MRLLAALIFAAVVLPATLGEITPNEELFSRRSLKQANYALDTVSNANMKPLHGQAVSDPACCTAGVHLTYCFVRWVTGYVFYRRVGAGESWKSLGRWIVNDVSCVAHGTDVTVITVQGTRSNAVVISNTIRNGKFLGWKGTGGINAQEAPGCVARGLEIYCMYRGPTCGASIIYTVKGVWQKPRAAGGILHSPVAAWYTAASNEVNFYATTAAHHIQVYTIKGGKYIGWRQQGTFVMIGRPSVCARQANYIDIFTHGSGSNLLWLQRNTKGQYLSWKNIGGVINYAPACVGRAGGINCFGVSPKLEFQRKTYSGGKWTAWTRVASGYIGTPSCHFSIAGVNIISCYVRNTKTGIDAFAFIS